jgi:DNA-directed RNA polymerase subunit RPC12/RpoP
MNDKYISVSKFKQSLAKLTVEGGDKKYAEAIARTLSEVVPYLLDDSPAADVQPVKRGRWIDCTFYDPYEKSCEQNFEYKCSCCGHMIYNKPNDDNLFCGHCGARMIKDDE